MKMKSSQSKWIVLIGIAGSVASIVALLLTFTTTDQNSGKSEQKTNISGLNNIVTSNQINNNEGIITYQNINLDTKKDVRDFKKFVPKTYLSNLPKVKYNAYMEAHKYWDTGTTSQMLQGTEVLYEHLREILIGLSATAYTEEYFEGKSIPEYYDEQISRLMKASYDSQPTDGGTMHLVMAHGDLTEIADDFIVRVVKDVADPEFFSLWKKRWHRASELGARGEHVDLDLASEF